MAALACSALPYIISIYVGTRRDAKAVGDIGLSSITLAELRFGAARSTRHEQNRAALDQFLLPLDIAVFDELAVLAIEEHT